MKLRLIGFILVLLAGLGLSVSAEPVIWDSFEPGIPASWSYCSGSQARMETSSNDAHSGTHSGLAQPNWRWAYTLCRSLPTAYSGDFYFSAWVRDECNTNPGMPGPPDNPSWSIEHVPHAKIRIEDSNGFDSLHMGMIGQNKRATDPQWPRNMFFSIETTSETLKTLMGPPYSAIPVPREPGWRKWMIRVKPYTGNRGDVEFYLDGQLIYQGLRASTPMGPATFDRVALGSNTWTGEWYLYDDAEFDNWPAPVACSDIATALTHADGDWVQINGLQVDSAHPDYITLADPTGAVDVYPARFEAPEDVVNVTGKLATSPSGRYIDSLVVEKTTTQPVLQVSSLAEARALPDGTRVRIPDRVVTASLYATRFVQEEDRSCGLRIRNLYEPAVGDRIAVEGQVMTVGPEKLLEAEKVATVSRNNVRPKAVGVTNKVLYQPDSAPNGMLVVTTGLVVTKPNMLYPGWVEIRDGSQPASAPPIRVQLPSYTVCPKVGDYVWVRGAAGWLIEKTSQRPQIFCAALADIQVVKAVQP